MKEQTPKTPTSSRSIVRDHSPYSESTGPIVPEGFVAARIRALQGFSNQGQIVTRSRSHLTPCPPRKLRVLKSRSPPRPSFTQKPALVGTDMPGTVMVKYHTEILSKRHQNVVIASGVSPRSSDVSRPVQPQNQLKPITPSKEYVKGGGAGFPLPDPFKDTILSPHAQRNQENLTAPNTPFGPLSDADHVDNAPEVHSSPSGNAILSPHAIRADLVEPRATWTCLPQTEDCNNNYNQEQALKPRGSIADKLGSLVERGWVGGDRYDNNNSDDGSASHTTESKLNAGDTRLDSRSSSEMPRPKEVSSYSGSLSLSRAATRSDLQHSTGECTPPHVKQRKPTEFVHRDSQIGGQRQARLSPDGKDTQRSMLGFGVPYFKTNPANPTKKQRAWTLHHFGWPTGSRSPIQPEASSTIWPSGASGHRRSEQGHESTKPPTSRESSIPNSGFESNPLGEEQLGQDSANLATVPGSRRSSSNTKQSARSISRSTSFFKKFPWYKVALVDKQPVVQDLSKAECGDDRVSSFVKAARHDLTSNPIELQRGLSKSHPVVERGHEEDGKASKTKTLPNQPSIDQEAMDAIRSYRKDSSQPSLQLMTSPPTSSNPQILQQIQWAPERPQYPHATSSRSTEDRHLGNPPQVVRDMIGHVQSPIKSGPSGMQPGSSPQSGSMDAGFEASISGAILQSLPQWPEVKKQYRMSPYTSSGANSMKLHSNERPEPGSPDSETAGSVQDFFVSPNPSYQSRSKVVNLSPKRLGTSADSSPTSIHKSDQHGPVRRDIKVRGKGIKKIQVTVTFDGAEDLAIEATLKKKDRKEHWRTMA